MKPFLLRLAGLVCLSGPSLALAVAASGARAGTSGAIYDMQRMLSAPHPFASPPPPPSPRLSPPPAAAPQAPRAAPRAAPRVAPSVAPQGGESRALWDVISEVRGGILAHD